MDLTITATFFLTAACILAYGDELQELVIGFRPKTKPQPSSKDAPKVLQSKTPLSMLPALSRDLQSSDPARWERALSHIPNYPPQDISKALVPLLDGPSTDLRDRIADLLLRHGLSLIHI